MTDRKLNEQIDACRPASNDLQLPELHALAAALQADADLRHTLEQRQQQDQQIAAKLYAVPLSAKRRARLLPLAQAVARASTASEPVCRNVRQIRRQRRLVLAGLGLGAITLSFAALLTWHWLNPWRTVSPQQLAQWAARDWAPEATAWRPMGELPGQRRAATSRYLRFRPARWQAVHTHLDQQTLVFDLPGHRQPAHLFVLRAHQRVRRLPTGPPQQPQTAYEGWLFAAWQEGVHVYLLAAAGSTQHYHDIVKTPGQSLAGELRGTGAPLSR